MKGIIQFFFGCFDCFFLYLFYLNNIFMIQMKANFFVSKHIVLNAFLIFLIFSFSYAIYQLTKEEA